MIRVGMRARIGVSSLDFQLVLAGSIALLMLASAGDQIWQLPRLALSSLYVLYVPGYCLSVLLFPLKDNLDSMERLGLSIGLSIALVAILALLLDWLPWGIQPLPTLLIELSATSILALAALLRRSALASRGMSVVGFTGRPRLTWRSLPVLEKRITVLLGSVLLLGLLSTGWILAMPSPKDYSTEFYILGKGGLAEDYPREAVWGEALDVTIGITNRETGERTYDFEVWVVDPWDPSRRTMVSQDPGISLSPGQVHEQTVSWSMPWSGDDQQVDFLLFVGGDPQPYRQLRLWLNVLPRAPAH